MQDTTLNREIAELTKAAKDAIAKTASLQKQFTDQLAKITAYSSSEEIEKAFGCMAVWTNLSAKNANNASNLGHPLFVQIFESEASTTLLACKEAFSRITKQIESTDALITESSSFKRQLESLINGERAVIQALDSHPARQYWSAALKTEIKKLELSVEELSV